MDEYEGSYVIRIARDVTAWELSRSRRLVCHPAHPAGKYDDFGAVECRSTVSRHIHLVRNTVHISDGSGLNQDNFDR